MKFAYADPPYLGCGKLYADQHPGSLDWDRPETHRALIDRLIAEFPDGWAMSLSSPSLRTILPMCPEDVRVMAWTKSFAVFKPNVNPAYAWEPVIVQGGRKHERSDPKVRDWVSEPVALMKGFTGCKREGFCFWIFDVLNMQPDDEFCDLFPGSGAVGRYLKDWKRSQAGILFPWGMNHAMPDAETAP